MNCSECVFVKRLFHPKIRMVIVLEALRSSRFQVAQISVPRQPDMGLRAVRKHRVCWLKLP